MPAVLSPSELVLLRATDFVPTTTFGTHALGAPVKVNERAWMRATYLAATAAVVEAGDSRLTLEQSKRLFGLLTGRKVVIARASGAQAWPAGSLEARLLAQLGDGSGVELSHVYWTLIGQTTPTPTALALEVARRGLVDRGLVEARQSTTLKVFVSTEFVVPTATRALADAAAVEPVKARALAGGAIPPETWTHVERALANAISARTKATSGSANVG